MLARINPKFPLLKPVAATPGQAAVIATKRHSHLPRFKLTCPPKMKVTLNWLKQYVDFNWPPEELTERLTMLGLEVEGVQKMSDADLAAIITNGKPPKMPPTKSLKPEEVSAVVAFVRTLKK